MLPLLPFALGLLTGAVAVRALKSDPARSGMDRVKSTLGNAQSHLRDAAVSSLTVIENTSARARDRLSGRPEPAPAPEAPPEAPAGAAEEEPVLTERRRPAARKRTRKAPQGGEGPTA